MTIHLVRHGHAGRRHAWDGDDAERPLSSKGRAEAEGLRQRLQDRPVTRVLSSGFVRCQQTVAPIAEQHDLNVEIEDALAEGASTADAIALIESLIGTEAVLCSHGDVIPEVMAALHRDGVKIKGRHRAAKGGTYALHTKGKHIVTATYIDPPALD